MLADCPGGSRKMCLDLKQKGALPPSWREIRQFTPRIIFATKMTKGRDSNDLFTLFVQSEGVVQAGAPMAIDGDDQYSFTPAGTGQMARARSDSAFWLSLSQKYSRTECVKIPV